MIGTATNWTIADAPKTTTANTPDFSFKLVSAGAAAPVTNPTWSAKVNMTCTNVYSSTFSIILPLAFST